MSVTLDVDTLETFYEMAREGAGLAASRLTPMTDIQARVGVTRLHFMNRPAIAEELDDGTRKVGISVTLAGGLRGRSLILFDEDSAREVAETLVADVPAEDPDGLAESAIMEVSQIMNNGFVDGWADVLGTEIDVSTPQFVQGTSPDELAEGVESVARDGLAVAFRSHIEAVDREIGFQHYVIPERDAVEQLFGGREGERVIEYEKLAGFDRLTREGAGKVAENLARMTGIDAEVEVRHIDFISLDAIPEDVSNEKLVSVAFTFDGTPSGYLLFLFDRASAAELVGAAMGTDPPDELGAMERDAIKELSNVMTSGLLDGWANVLDTSIDHSTPAYTYDMGAAVVDPLVVGLSERQEFAFVFDTHIRAVDVEFDLDIYAIPDEEDLIRALDALEAASVDGTPFTAEFAAAEADPEAVATVEDIEEVEST